MKIKKFAARTFAEALELVKKELSEDAVILSTEEKKGFRPHVEVTAAVDYDGESLRNADCQLRNERPGDKAAPPEERAERDAVRNHVHSAKSAIHNPKSAIPQPGRPDRATPHNAASAGDGVGQLKSEIDDLRAMLESMKNNGYEMSLPAAKRTVLNFLRERSVRDEFALRLCDRTTDLAEIPKLISSDIRTRPQGAARKAVMFIGPTGVGKTTTIAKLAARAVQAGRKAAIINLDTYRIGAVEQVRIYSRILGIPLATVASADEFRGALRRFAETRDIVFVDTTGRNPRDEASLRDIAGICGGDMPLELHLLMSANTHDECMIEAHRSYRSLPIDYISFSKIDEAVRFGPLYNVLLTYQKPVSWLTTGQRVPGDIEQATAARLTDLIMAKEC